MGQMFATLKSQGQRYVGVYCIFMILSVVVSVTIIASTVMMGELAQAARYANQDVLLGFLLIVTGIFLLRALASAFSVLLLGRFGARAGFTFRENFARYFLQKPFSAFMERKSGESLSVFANDLPQATDLVSVNGPRMFADILALIIMVAYMLSVNWWLTLIFFASFPVLIAMQVLISLPIQKKSLIRQEAIAKYNAVVNDSFQNTSTVAAFSLEKIVEKRVMDAYEVVFEAQKARVKAMLGLVLAGIGFSLAPVFIITVVLGQQVIGGHMSFAEFMVFFALSAEAGGWLQMLSQTQNNLKTTEAGAKRLVDHIDGITEDMTNGKVVAASEIAARAVDLSFSYNPEEESALALDEVNFSISRGRRVAFVGGSGSGKSTVLKLLLRLYEPTSGELFVMGVKSSEAALGSLRSAISYVPQDSFLFPETIAANITGHDTPPDMVKLEKAAADAGILEFVKNHPDKWDAVLSESAENISGGQKQRIALARAFYKDADIILFDEATSALDPTTEAEILKSFENLPKDKTLIMVAHRIKAIRFCDEIIVMDGGKVAGIGSHDELLKDNDAYKNLYESQEKELA